MVAILFSLFFAGFSQAQILSPEMNHTDPHQQEVLSLIPIMEARIGRTLPYPVVIWQPGRRLSTILEDERRRTESYAAAWSTPAFVSVDGSWELDNAYNPNHACLITLGPSAILATGALRTTMLAHEIFHCFQFVQIGRPGVDALPRWIIEGSAEYAGEFFSNGTYHAEPYWLAYLGGPIGLSRSDYHAIGIFASLHSIGISDVFQKIDVLLTSDPATLWNKLGLILGAAEKSGIPAAAKMKSEWGESYTIDFPGVPTSNEFPTDVRGEITLPQQVELFTDAIQHLQFSIPSGKIIRIKIAGESYGRLRIMNASQAASLDTEIGPNTATTQDLKICRGEPCGCASGNPAYDVIHLPWEADTLNLYMLSYTTSASHIVFEEAEPGCCPGSQGIDPRLVGTWKIEPQIVLANRRPVPNPETEKIVGHHTVRIYPTGEFQRTGTLKTKYTWVSGRHHKKEFRTVHSSVNGCIETRGTNPGQGWIFHRILNENSWHELVAYDNGRKVVDQHHDTEDPYIRWGMGTTGENSIYRFVGDQLTIRGEPRTYIRSSE